MIGAPSHDHMRHWRKPAALHPQQAELEAAPLAVRRLARRYRLPVPTAAVIAAAAGLGDRLA